MKILLTLTLFLAAGCTPPGLNLQRSILRGSGDAAVTFVLDEVSDKNFDASSAKIKSIIEGVSKFLDGGKVADLTQSQLKDEIQKLVPVKYKSWADQLLAVASATEVDVDKIAKIGKNNILRLRAFLDGTLTGLKEYSKDQRPVEEVPTPVPVTPPVAATP